MRGHLFFLDPRSPQQRLLFACGCAIRCGDTIALLNACDYHAQQMNGSARALVAPAPACQVHGKLLACPSCQGARGGRAVTPRKLEQLRAAARRPRKAATQSQPAGKQGQPAAKRKGT